MHPELELLIRLLIAAAFAGLLGWERESAHKPAGLRTHMLVGIAAALYTALAELAVSRIHPAAEGFQADPIRAIQAVAIGIGFLGSGVIFVSRHEDRVHGLTGAAYLDGWIHVPGGATRRGVSAADVTLKHQVFRADLSCGPPATADTE